MKKMISLRRTLAGFLSLVLVVSLCAMFIFGPGTSARAITSLPHISHILTTQTEFNIIEIIPREGAGSLGYYVSGQEPFSDWETLFSDPGFVSDREGRIAYANSLLSALSGAGLLGRGASNPLTYTGSASSYTYDEKYIWELTDGSGNANLSGWNELRLPSAESASVTGTFSEGNGYYDALHDYVFDRGGGDFVQNIEFFFAPESFDPDLDSYFYYVPTFAPITLLNLYDPKVFNHACYTLDESTGVYSFYGIVDDDITLEADTQYYYVDSAGDPLPAEDFYNAASGTYSFPVGWYAASPYSDVPFVPGSGYFVSSITGYIYDPDGGSYVFVPGGAGGTHTVYADTVYYKGMITNNDWFLRHVFDVSAPASSRISVKVKSVMPGQLTSSMISGADMIVLSAGFDPQTPGVSLTSAYTSNDISSDLAWRVYSAMAEGCPLIVDYRLTALGNLNITRLAQLCLMGYNEAISQANFSTYSYTWSPPSLSNFVSGNVLCFYSPFQYSGANEISDLASPLFTAAFSAGVIADGFSAVLKEIKSENFLRKVDAPGTTDLLPEEVTLANSIRYIVNYSGQRTLSTKEYIRVLDLEPGNAKDGALTTETVLGWLGDGSGYDAEDISITTMSTAEFIGKIEDINEKYDLVYIGACIDGFNTRPDGGEIITDYNDNDMDGLIYTNIGDLYRSSSEFRGLLSRDSGADHNLFRFSGNDITPSKVKELLYFAQGGYPVVIANDLFLPAVSDETTPFSVNISASVSGTTVTLAAHAIDSASGTTMRATFRWYRVGSGTVLETDSNTTSASYSFSPAPGSENRYYCVVTAASYPAENGRSNNVLVTYRSDITVTVDTGSSSRRGYYGGDTTAYYNASISASPGSGLRNGDSVTVSAVPTYTDGTVITGYTSISYQWYGANNASSSGGTPLPGATGSSIRFTVRTSGNTLRYTYNSSNYNYSHIFCRITLNGGTYADSKRAYLTRGGSTRSIGYDDKRESSGYYTVSAPRTYFDVIVSGAPDSSSAAVLNAAAVDINGIPITDTSFEYYWYYRDGATWRSYGSGKSISVDLSSRTSITLYCAAYAEGSSNYATSYNVIVSRGNSVSAVVQSSGAYDGAYYKTDYSSTGDINTARVDSKSYMFKALNAIRDRANVMSVSEIESSTLHSYLNLSKPKIILTSFPAVYENDDGIMTSLSPVDGKYYLDYTFRIENETDPTPATTTYDCSLYIDLNSDGRYSEAEKLDDITVKRGGAIVYPLIDGDGNEYYRLSAGVTYSVSRQVPTQYAGIIPWKLEVVKNGAERIHASVHNYTRIAPYQSQEIKVLQITDDDLSIGSSGSNIINLEEQQEEASYSQRNEKLYSRVTNKYYKGIYGKLLADVSDFNVKIKTIKANALENLQFGGFTPPSGSDADKIYAYLDTFDMVIIGFNDMFGEIRQDTAAAVTRYIDSGKSILFTHDTTSFWNTNDSAGWGYFFNTIIRDKVGLDRYGITSNEFRSILYTETESSDLTASEIESILAGNYSVAFDPDPDKSGTVPEAHGFTNYELIRYGQSGQYKYTKNDYTNRETTYVSQVNEGQITTYPYDINTPAFKGTGSTNYMSVLLTHEQYYQLNMNPDDIVVWFCLSSGPYTSTYYYNDLPNDAVNAYYIFNRGNVTYSGVGHTSATSNYSNPGTAAINEAKLFVNTMIAAYQSGKQDPTVKIVDDATGDNEISYLYFHGDFNGAGPQEVIESGTDSYSTTRRLYFELSDTNLDKDKQLSVEFSCEGIAGNFELTVYKANTNNEVAHSLTGGKVYYVYLTDAILNALGSDEDGSVTLTLYVTTTMSSTQRRGEASVELRRIGLFDLQ